MGKILKYKQVVIIPFIALGMTSICLVCANYTCENWPSYPIYHGSPFVFKETSLGSSLTYYYFVLGAIGNAIIWSLILLLIHNIILKIQTKFKHNSVFKFMYKGLVITLIVFSGLNLFFDYITNGRGFEKGRNYWYKNINKNYSNQEQKCNCTWSLLRR